MTDKPIPPEDPPGYTPISEMDSGPQDFGMCGFLTTLSVIAIALFMSALFTVAMYQTFAEKVYFDCRDAEYGASRTSVTDFGIFGHLTEKRGMTNNEFIRFCAERKGE